MQLRGEGSLTGPWNISRQGERRVPFSPLESAGLYHLSNDLSHPTQQAGQLSQEKHLPKRELDEGPKTEAAPPLSADLSCHSSLEISVS